LTPPVVWINSAANTATSVRRTKGTISKKKHLLLGVFFFAQ